MSKTNQLTTPQNCQDFVDLLATDLLKPAIAAGMYKAELESVQKQWIKHELDPTALTVNEAIELFKNKKALEEMAETLDQRAIEIIQNGIKERAYREQVEGRTSALRALLAGRVAPRASFIAGLKVYLGDIASRLFNAETTSEQRVSYITARDEKEAIALGVDKQIETAEREIAFFQSHPEESTWNRSVGAISVIEFA